tara:strand:+ start:5039 stop:6259 length:1221 start_codon:yes stop_codon:yes gene_type:complete
MKVSFASNLSPAQDAFVERQKYITNYPPGIRDYKQINLWYNEIMWGRINQKGDIVYPVEGFLKQLKGADDSQNYFVLNFVADAYEAFRNAMLQQESVQHFINLDGTPFEDRFQPTNGWISTTHNFNTYIQGYYENFILPFMSDPQRVNDIDNFDDFVTEFTQLVDRTSLLIPFTKTEYIVSKYSSPLVSGMMVEFDTKQHGEDLPKITEFINNVNFELYREIASQHGFVVDMNAPWRLVADIGSWPMQQFMAAYSVTYDILFDKYYYNSSFFDIPNIKVYMRSFYESFVQTFPTTRKVEIVSRNGRNISLTRVKKRATIDRKAYYGRYTNAFWVRFYIYIRAKETNREWDQYKFDHIVKRATDFLRYAGENATLKFINKEVKRAPGEYEHTDQYARGTFRFKRKRD